MNQPLTDHLTTLPTETLRSLASLTGRLRAEQHLRALEPDMLRALQLEAARKGNQAVGDMARTALSNQGARHV